MTKALSFILALTLFVSSADAQEKPLKVCLNLKKGTFSVKAKCRKAERVFSESAYTSPDTSLSVRIDGNTSSIGANSTAIEGIASTVTNHTNSIATLSSTTSSHTSTLGTLNTSVTSNTNNISTLQTGVTSNTNSIGTLNTSVAAHATSISTNAGNISQNATDIDSLETSVATNSGAISSLNTTVSGHTITLGTLDTTVSGHTTTLGTLSTTVSGHTTTLGSLGTTVSGHTTTLGTLGTTVSGHTTSISTISSALGDIPNPVKVYTVSASGAPYSTISSALTAAVTDGVDANNPALIKIGPGVYSISATLSLNAGISIQGSGQGVTRIVSSAASVLNASSSSVISDLSLEATSSSLSTIIHTGSATNLTLRNLTLSGAQNGTGAVTGILTSGGATNIENVSITFTNTQQNQVWGIRTTSNGQHKANNLNISIVAEGFPVGIRLQSTSSLELKNSTIYVNKTSADLGSTSAGLTQASTGTFEISDSKVTVINANGTGASGLNGLSAGTTRIRNSYFECSDGTAGCIDSSTGTILVTFSSIIADTAGNYAFRTGGTVSLAHSYLVGAAFGTVNCASNVDDSLAFFDTTCP